MHLKRCTATFATLPAALRFHSRCWDESLSEHCRPTMGASTGRSGKFGVTVTYWREVA